MVKFGWPSINKDDASSTLDQAATFADMEAIFSVFFNRSVGNEDWKENHVRHGTTIRQLLEEVRHSTELTLLLSQFSPQSADSDERIGRMLLHRVPADLSRDNIKPKRILQVGSCMLNLWNIALEQTGPSPEVDFAFFGSSTDAPPPRPIESYDFQLVQLPLRTILPDSMFARLAQTDIQGHEALFERCSQSMLVQLSSSMAWNSRYGILTFVMPFIVPQQNLIGRLFDRYDLRNPVFFVEKLNARLAAALREYNNVYYFDLNEVLSGFGRVYTQEDVIAAFNHNSFITDFNRSYDEGRLEKAQSVGEYYDTRVAKFVRSAYEELCALWRTVKRIDSVKLVVVDLDDTLWRGTIAETEEFPTSEGWPKAFWEALLILKRRGIILGIISKNDESRVLEVWDQILGGQLSLDDFAIRKIGWGLKSEYMAEILAEVGVLPGNVVYVDDNPSQRADIQGAFPDIRVLGGAPYRWRQILLWAPETQVATVTDESGQRTEMVRAQVEREHLRRIVSREEFLRSIGMEIIVFRIDTPNHPRFVRALELINKTNQFNTTGERWSTEQMCNELASGGVLYAASAKDSFTEYGLVAVSVVRESYIRQFVMSCRVMGMDVEKAVLSLVSKEIAEGHVVTAAMRETERNSACRDIFARCGFERDDDSWRHLDTEAMIVPAHIRWRIDAPPA